MAIDPGAIGRVSDPVTVTWTAKDAMLYAISVGVGADDPAQGLGYTTENSAGIRLRTLPTFCVVLSGGVAIPSYGEIDKSKLLHAEQAFEFHQPLPPEGEAVVQRSIEDLLDKGNAAIVVTRTTFHTRTGVPLCTLRSTAYLRDHGGFGGRRGSATPWAAPDRAPDIEFTQQTCPNSALLYRLNSDRNPLHSDPAFARRAGLDQPILHGLCTLGHAAQGLIGRLPFGPDAWRRLSARFSASVLPGDRLTTQVWVDGRTVRFRTHVGARVVLDHGTLHASENPAVPN